MCCVFKSYFTAENFYYMVYLEQYTIYFELHQCKKMRAEWKIIGKEDKEQSFCPGEKPHNPIVGILSVGIL